VFRYFGFACRRFALQGFVLAACVATLSSPGSADGSLLTGKDQWDPDVVRQFFKHEFSLDIGPGPGDYPNRQMLTGLTRTCHYDDGGTYTVTSHANAEFAKRVDVLMAVYRAKGGKDVGIVPCDGALRSEDYQLHLYKKGRHDPAGPNGQTPVAQWVQDDPHAKCVSGAMVTCETVSWHNVGLAVDFGQFTAAGKYDNGDKFLQEDAWGKVYESMADLGMLSGAYYGDNGHVDWHPYLLKPADAGQSGTAATNVNAGYAWKLSSTVYSWSPVSHSLNVIDFGSDGNWITVKDSRRIETQDDGGFRGIWVTYNPAIKLFPAYTPTVRFENWNHLYQAATTVEVKTYVKSVFANGSRDGWTDHKGSLEYFSYFGLRDLQNEADVALNIAKQYGSNSQEYKDAVKLWRILRANSFYSVSFELHETGSGHPCPYKRHEVMHITDAKDQTSDEEGTDQFGSKALLEANDLAGFGGLGWNRDTGAVGFYDIISGSDTYNLRSTLYGFFGEKTHIRSSKLPAGAKDQTAPPSWPF
jgi:hypothetical protein